MQYLVYFDQEYLINIEPYCHVTYLPKYYFSKYSYLSMCDQDRVFAVVI